MHAVSLPLDGEEASWLKISLTLDIRLSDAIAGFSKVRQRTNLALHRCQYPGASCQRFQTFFSCLEEKGVVQTCCLVITVFDDMLVKTVVLTNMQHLLYCCLGRWLHYEQSQNEHKCSIVLSTM